MDDQVLIFAKLPSVYTSVRRKVLAHVHRERVSVVSGSPTGDVPLPSESKSSQESFLGNRSKKPRKVLVVREHGMSRPLYGFQKIVQVLELGEKVPVPIAVRTSYLE